MYVLTENRKGLPTFLICGAAQAGTSFLVGSIMQHPEIFMPQKSVPEPHFFLKSWEYEKGLEAYKAKWFSKIANQKAVGEKSSSYLFGGRLVADRIKTHIPDVRLIVMLRNPVERTWAHYRFSVLNGLEDLPFEDALKQEANREKSQSGKWAEIQPFNYTGRSKYAKQLTPYFEVFDQEQVLIMKSESFSLEPENCFKKIFNHLSVDEQFQPSFVPRFTSVVVKDPARQVACRKTFTDRFGLVLKAVRSNTDPFIHAKDENERKAIIQLMENLSQEAPRMSAWARDYLNDLFREDIEKLSTMVDFRLWETQNKTK